MTGLLILSLVLVGLWMARPGCPHRRQSMPITMGGKTYRVCLDCTRQIRFRAYR